MYCSVLDNSIDLTVASMCLGGLKNQSTIWDSLNAVVDTLELIEVSTIEVYDENENIDYSNKSIISTVCKNKILAPSEEMFVNGIKYTQK
jgi:hypothetical protein